MTHGIRTTAPWIVLLLLAAPIAWSVQLLASYFLVTFHLGLSHLELRILILLVAVVAGAVALVAAFFGMRGEDAGGLLDDDVDVRAFAGQSGVLLALLFGLAILALTIPVFMERL